MTAMPCLFAFHTFPFSPRLQIGIRRQVRDSGGPPGKDRPAVVQEGRGVCMGEKSCKKRPSNILAVDFLQRGRIAFKGVGCLQGGVGHDLQGESTVRLLREGDGGSFQGEGMALMGRGWLSRGEDGFQG